MPKSADVPDSFPACSTEKRENEITRRCLSACQPVISSRRRRRNGKTVAIPTIFTEKGSGAARGAV